MPTASAAPRHWSNLAPALGDPIRTLDLVLASEGISKGTRRIYCESLVWLALRTDSVGSWSDLTPNDVRQHLAWMLDEGYSTSYVSNQLRGMKAGFKRLAKEESIPDILRDITGPTPVPKLVPVLEDGDLGRLLQICNGGVRWEDLRDKAIILILASSGCRLGELAGMTTDKVDLDKNLAFVTGKGSKPRFIRFNAAAGLAVSRYLRARRAACLAIDVKGTTALWVGRKGPLTVSGCFQAFKRRARMAGMPDLHPHVMRHDFSHRWLAAGGQGNDLMELAGWSSASMLNRYGKSAAAARASTAYDRIMTG